MKTLLTFVIAGAIIGYVAEGNDALALGAVGGFCFWLLIKIAGFLNRHTSTIDKAMDALDDD